MPFIEKSINEDGKEKRMKTRKNPQKRNKLITRIELLLFIVNDGIISFGKNIILVFLPAAGSTGVGFSAFSYKVFSIVTLEGPRLMLLSRYHASHLKSGTKIGLSAVGGAAAASIIISLLLISSQLFVISFDEKIGFTDDGHDKPLVQQGNETASKQIEAEKSGIIIQETSVTTESIGTDINIPA